LLGNTLILIVSMSIIQNISFKGNRIYMTTDEGASYSLPLEAFPVLMQASPTQRKGWVIGKFGDDVRWPELDEDIHISSFFEEKEPDYSNEVAEMFAKYPELNVSQIAASIGINKSLLAKYIYGIKHPSPERVEEIRQALHDLGTRLLSA